MKQIARPFVLAAAAAVAGPLTMTTGCVGSIPGDGEQPGEMTDGTLTPRPGGKPGSAQSPGQGSTPAGTPGPGSTATPPPPSVSTVGATPLRRLTRLEYANTVRDLLGPAVPSVSNAFSADTLGVAGFTVGGSITPVEAIQYQEAAEALAAVAIKDLKSLLPCDQAKDGEAACADRFIGEFGKRAYRRPLVAEETADLKALYATARQDGYDFANGIRLLLETMLQSPNFLYRGEFGLPGATGGKMRPLTTYEVATRLSYFLWQTMPDQALFADADSGALAKPDVLEKHARRLLADPRARATVSEFGVGWLHLDYGDLVKDGKLYADFTDKAKLAMGRELGEFLAEVLLVKGDANLLFTADYTFADAALAKIYGVTAPAGDGLAKVTFDPAQGRAGLLTQVAFLAKNAGPSAGSPTRRGVQVRENFLCQEIPPPPPDLEVTPPKNMAMKSVREQVDEHRSNPMCAPCHNTFDPIGLAFEAFDGIGRFRTTDGGKDVITTGELSGTDVDGPLTGAKDLMTRLARSEVARKCVAQKVFRFAMARKETEDQAALDRVFATFASKGFDARELMVALVKSESFLYRPAN